MTLSLLFLSPHHQDINVTEECGSVNLPSLVSKVVDNEEDNFPTWLRNENKITKNSSTADEIRGHLRHIVLPHSLHSYQQLRCQLSKTEIVDKSTNNRNENISENEIINEINNDKKILKSESSMKNVEKSSSSMDFSILSSLSSVTTIDSKNLNKVRNFFDKIKSGNEEGKNSSDYDFIPLSSIL